MPRLATVKRKLHARMVNRDMNLYSILLDWIGILTQPCVLLQVFYLGMRQAGRPEYFGLPPEV